MEIVKKYWQWILLGAAALAVVGIQFFYVGARWQETLAKNQEIASKLQGSGGDLAAARTRGDIALIQKRLQEMQSQRLAVEKKLYEITGGLNEGMSHGARPTGTLLDPDTNEPIDWSIFPVRLDALFDRMISEGEKILAAAMLEKLPRVYADEVFAGDRLKTRAEAEEEGRRLAEDRAPRLARIIHDPAALKVVRVDADRFSADDPKKGWAVWRKYLILKDIIRRAIPAAAVAIPRTLNACQPLDDDARLELKAKNERGEPLGEPETREMASEEWRFVEMVEAIRVSDPVPGNSEFSAQRPKSEGEAKAEGGEEPAAKPVDAATALVFYDRFTVSMSVVAHPKAVVELQRQILASPNIFYVPTSLVVSRFSDEQVMSGSGASNAAAVVESGRTLGTSSEDKRAAAELQVAALFHREPAVRAEMIFEVYRFRYADTDNQ